MLFSLLFNVRLLASELHIHPSGMRDKRLERADCPTGGVELLACGLGTFRLGTLRLGTLRLGTLRLGTFRLGALRLGALGLGTPGLQAAPGNPGTPSMWDRRLARAACPTLFFLGRYP